VTRARAKKSEFEPGLIPAPGRLLDWQDLPCELCGKPTPMRSHSGEPAHKACAESWIAANPTEARRGRFASDLHSRRRDDTHA
jgi:hypothetical protein